MNIRILADGEAVSRAAADCIAALVREKPDCRLGLATGSTPVGAYRNLADRVRAGELDLSRVTTFNLDEYQPMAEDNPASYRRFMRENLFDPAGIPLSRTHFPDGSTADENGTCREYDAAIRAAGGIDLQLLGVGRNGHIAFNEPGAALVAPTHLTPLTESTIRANARFFASSDEVPRSAVTMGMATIFAARRILLLIIGRDKHDALRRLYDDTVDPACPVTFLKLHPDVTVLADEAAYAD